VLFALAACGAGDDIATTAQYQTALADAFPITEADAGAPADATPCAGQPEPACPTAPAGYQPQDPGIRSKAKCRGACGPDCPPSCSIGAPVSTCLEWQDAQCGWHAKTCTYQVQRCGSHLGCRVHDACYDGCAFKWTEPLRIACRRACDVGCIAKYGEATCESWMMGGKPYDSYIEYTSAPTSSTYDSTCY